MPVCAVCGGTEIDNDATRGDSVCVKCGHVMESNMIIAEVSYTDASAGGGVMIGQFVNADGRAPYGSHKCAVMLISR